MTAFSDTSGAVPRPATLEDVLRSREERAERQRELLEGFGVPVVSFTPVAPGARKGDLRFRRVHREGLLAIRRTLEAEGLPILHEESLGGPGGYGTLFSVRADALRLKALMAAIEETHPGGRLFDIDVISENGGPVGRIALGLPRRKCLLCGGPAGDCARSRAHALPDLVAAVDQIIERAGLEQSGDFPW